MITYTYIVKCPECDDEFFDFFDEAKDFAMGCLTKKPVITQTEVNRNDFGECTDHCDLGTVWSWEDMMKDTEPEDMVFSKDETFGISEGLDDFDDFDIGPQIDEFDNSLDFEIEDDIAETLWVAENLNGGEIVAACWADSEDLAHRLLSQAFRERTGGDLRDCYIREAEANEPDYITDNPNLLAEACERKPIPEGMTTLATNKRGDYLVRASSGRGYTVFNRSNVCLGGITGDDDEEAINRFQRGDLDESTRVPVPEGMTVEQLVEEMEENEDTVECAGCQELFPKEECTHKDGYGWLCDDCVDNVVKCTWCEELYDRSECRREVDLGWLCSRCEMGIKSRGETLTFREGSYWDDLDEEVEPDSVHDLGNTYDGGYPEDDLTEGALTEAIGYDCPKLKEADNNKPGIAKFKIISQFRKNPAVQGDYGDCPYLSGTGTTATFKRLTLRDSTRASYGEVQDIELADNGEVMLVTTTGKKYSLRQALRIASPATDKISDTRKVLIALKNAAEAAERSLDARQVRNLRVRNALAQLNQTVADEFKDAITDIVFRIPAHNAYSADDILDIDPDASEAIAEKAADKINKIHDDFYSLDFVKQHRDAMESSGMIEDRVPNEKATWINSSWGAVGKVYFDRPTNKLSVDAQKIIANAKLSDAKVDPDADSVDCYRLATELIRFFDNDPWFYTKPVESDEPAVADVDNALDLDFPEV